MMRMTNLKRTGIAAGIAGLALSCWGMFGVLQGGAVTAAPTATDPGCTPSTPAPGNVVVCLHEDQEGVTASSFSDQSCDQVVNRDDTLDYFIFVLPDSGVGDPARVFTPPPPTVFFDTGTTTGVIGSNAKFFVASAPQGATLLEAQANADNGTQTPTGDMAQFFNLTHTCPASVTGSQSGTTTTGTTTTGTTTTGTTSTGTTTTGTTSTGTTTTGTTSTTTSTPTGGVSGTTTSASTTATGGVSGASTTGSTGGVGGISTPNTGAGAGLALLTGVLLMGLGGGLAGLGSLKRRNR